MSASYRFPFTSAAVGILRAYLRTNSVNKKATLSIDLVLFHVMRARVDSICFDTFETFVSQSGNCSLPDSFVFRKTASIDIITPMKCGSR